MNAIVPDRNSPFGIVILNVCWESQTPRAAGISWFIHGSKSTEIR